MLQKFVYFVILILLLKMDYWSGREFGYDQIGYTDPYYYSYNHMDNIVNNITDEINVITPQHEHNHQISYEKNAYNSKCQELLLDLRNKEDEIT